MTVTQARFGTVILWEEKDMKYCKNILCKEQRLGKCHLSQKGYHDCKEKGK
jgi:hypothetical protein